MPASDLIATMSNPGFALNPIPLVWSGSTSTGWIQAGGGTHYELRCFGTPFGPEFRLLTGAGAVVCGSKELAAGKKYAFTSCADPPAFQMVFTQVDCTSSLTPNTWTITL